MSRICTNCVMDDVATDIQFDDNGICNYCHHYEQISNQLLIDDESQREKALAKVVEGIKSNTSNQPYDCILGLSGGVDSSYLAYLANALGLRVLAIHLDNGWNDEIAVQNIEKICNKTGIELHTHVINWQEFKDLQLAFLRASVPNIEIPTDHAITALLYNFAAKYNIKTILSGSNVKTEGILPNCWGYDSKDFRHIKHIHKLYGNQRLKTFPKLTLSKLAYYKYVKKIKTINLLNYIDYNKNNALDTLQREYDWKNYQGKHYESIFTKFFQAYILPHKFGIDKRKAHLSSLIVSKQLQRKEALQLLQQPLYQSQTQQKADLNYFLSKMGLSDKEFNKLIQGKPKSHNDYKTTEKFIELVKKYLIYKR